MAERTESQRIKDATYLAVAWIKLRAGLYPTWTESQARILQADLKAAAEACGQDVGTLLSTVGASLGEADPELAERVRRKLAAERGAEVHARAATARCG